MAVFGVICAMDVEIARLKSILNAEKEPDEKRNVYKGARNGHTVILVQCGIGKVNAAALTQYIIDRYDVEYIINSGIAGGLDKSLEPLDVVISESTSYHDFLPEGLMRKCLPSGGIFPADKKLVSLAEKACKACTQVKNYRVGPVGSGDSFVNDSEKADYLRNERGFACVEMEGAAVGQTCFLNGVPYVVIRSISDFADNSAQMSYEQFESTAADHASFIVEFILDLF